MNGSSSRDELIAILKNARVEVMDYWLRDFDAGFPAREKALFLREIWSGIMREGNSEWLDSSIKELASRIGAKDCYSLRFRPEQPSLLEALRTIQASGVDVHAVAHLLRHAQIQQMEWMLSIIDGGHCFGDGLCGNWAMCGMDEDGKPTESFGDMKYEYWQFDPQRSDV